MWLQDYRVDWFLRLRRSALPLASRLFCIDPRAPDSGCHFATLSAIVHLGVGKMSTTNAELPLRDITAQWNDERGTTPCMRC